MADLAVEARNVSKTFLIPHEQRTTIKEHFLHPFRRTPHEENRALQNVSFDIRQGEFFGVIGPNGSGKSTLLKILAGIYRPDEGAVRINGRLSPFIELGVGFSMELNARDNVRINGTLLGLKSNELDDKLEAIVRFAELDRFRDQKLKHYSSGMLLRLAYAIAIQVPFDILLLDEVLAVGDQDFQEKCFATFTRFQGEGKTIVFVSHDLGTVRRFCDRALLLEGGITRAVGQTDDVVARYEHGDEPLPVEDRNGCSERATARSGSTAALAFVCNICGAPAVARRNELERDRPSCPGCGSSVRARGVIHALSLTLFEQSLPLSEFPRRDDLTGVGISEDDPYEVRLGSRLKRYRPMHFDREPFLNVFEPPPELDGALDFMVSTDVLEHAPVRVEAALAGIHRLLRPGGILVLSAPYTLDRDTIEHFPELHEYELVETGGRKVLINHTPDGRRQVFDELVFHGGQGLLELRRFGRAALVAALEESGFEDLRELDEDVPSFGIVWNGSAFPIVGRKP